MYRTVDARCDEYELGGGSTSAFALLDVRGGSRAYSRAECLANRRAECRANRRAEMSRGQSFRVAVELTVVPTVVPTVGGTVVSGNSGAAGTPTFLNGIV